MLTAIQGLRTPYPLTFTTNFATTIEGFLFVGDATLGNITATLHDAARAPGHVIALKKLGVLNTLTISPSTGLLDGVASIALTVLNASVILQSDGTNWLRIA
jgi:hypothetical protein